MEFNEESSDERSGAKRGRRAEEVAQWYFRLNGFFLIPGFVVHPDVPRPTPRTEADLLGIRLKDSNEGLWHASQADHFRVGANRTSMTDDPLLTSASMVGTVKRHLVAMVEVKAGTCSINGPWSDRGGGDQTPGQSNMERALGRVGFGNRTEVTVAGSSMYENLRYEGNAFVVQYFAIGKTTSTALARTYPKLIQITFDQIGSFLRDRFNGFPEKIPLDRDIRLWQGFGDSFRWWFESSGYGSAPNVLACQSAVKRYINDGRC